MNWYVQIGDEQRGPMSSEELRQLALAGSIGESTPIKQGDGNKWSTAGKVKGLQFGSVKPPVLPKSVRKCPFCAEEISLEAIKCKHCGEFLTKNSEKPKDVLHSLEWSNDDLMQLIKKQKKLIVAFIAGEVLCLFPIWPLMFTEGWFLGFGMAMILRVWWAIVAYKIADLLYPRILPKVLIVTLIVFPLPAVASIVMLLVNDKATNVIQKHGIPVKLWGADTSKLIANQ